MFQCIHQSLTLKVILKGKVFKSSEHLHTIAKISLNLVLLEDYINYYYIKITMYELLIH